MQNKWTNTVYAFDDSIIKFRQKMVKMFVNRSINISVLRMSFLLEFTRLGQIDIQSISTSSKEYITFMLPQYDTLVSCVLFQNLQIYISIFQHIKVITYAHYFKVNVQTMSTKSGPRVYKLNMSLTVLNCHTIVRTLIKMHLV